MKRLIAALAASLALAACGHGAAGSGSGALTPPDIKDPIRLAVRPVTVTPDVTSSVPAVFEQTLCSRLFEYNQKQVTCADEIRVILEHKRSNAMLDGVDTSVDAVLAVLDAPRQVSLSAAKTGDAVTINVIVQDKAGATLNRFQMALQADGADVFERGNEAAIKILNTK